METKNNKQEHSLFIEGRIVKVKCTKEELTKYMQKIKDKCKELESLQSFKGELI
tara:strand:+ start:63 stop:224 length:162 start_codon:yes stop_codon:yes gene_type:complete